MGWTVVGGEGVNGNGWGGEGVNGNGWGGEGVNGVGGGVVNGVERG
jgi:hypothetical protein